LVLRDRATNGAVVALCGRMPALTEMDLRGASSVTDVALQAVAELEALTWLSLYGCSLVTDQGVQAVAELKSLTCACCSGPYVPARRQHQC
jgi:hypothetical protein